MLHHDKFKILSLISQGILKYQDFEVEWNRMGYRRCKGRYACNLVSNPVTKPQQELYIIDQLKLESRIENLKVKESKILFQLKGNYFLNILFLVKS